MLLFYFYYDLFFCILWGWWFTEYSIFIAFNKNAISISLGPFVDLMVHVRYHGRIHISIWQISRKKEKMRDREIHDMEINSNSNDISYLSSYKHCGHVCVCVCVVCVMSCSYLYAMCIYHFDVIQALELESIDKTGCKSSSFYYSILHTMIWIIYPRKNRVVICWPNRYYTFISIYIMVNPENIIIIIIYIHMYVVYIYKQCICAFPHRK